MKIQIHDQVQGFHEGKIYIGNVMEVGEVITFKTVIGIETAPLDSILKVNGLVFTDRPIEVYQKEKPESALIGEQMAAEIQKLIDNYDN